MFTEQTRTLEFSQTFGSVTLDYREDGIAVVSRSAEYPTEVDRNNTEILSPADSHTAISSSDRSPATKKLLGSLIRRGRVLDWREQGIGVGLDYSQFVNRVLDTDLLFHISQEQVPTMKEEGINCILAPDSSGGPLAVADGLAYSRAFRRNLFILRLNKGPSLTMNGALSVELNSYTFRDHSKPVVSHISVDPHDFREDIKYIASLREDIFDSGAMVVAVMVLMSQLRQRGINIELISLYAPWIKAYTRNQEVFRSLGIQGVHTLVNIEGLAPMSQTEPGLIKVEGIPYWLQLERTDNNGN